jgi:nucleotide-binding universal stress UspA family protein
MKVQTILFPTDYTPFASAAFSAALEMARLYHARLIVLHAVETLGPENVTYGEASSRKQPDSYRNRLWDDLHQIKALQDDVRLEYVLSEGGAARAILEAAATHGCDLIVMGSHGRTGFSRFLRGSVAEEVVRKAPCPVLVVKLPTIARPAHEEAPTDMHPHSLREAKG